MDTFLKFPNIHQQISIYKKALEAIFFNFIGWEFTCEKIDSYYKLSSLGPVVTILCNIFLC